MNTSAAEWTSRGLCHDWPLDQPNPWFDYDDHPKVETVYRRGEGSFLRTTDPDSGSVTMVPCFESAARAQSRQSTRRQLVNTALDRCSSCPVQALCLEAGADEPEGIWGGLFPSQREKVTGVRQTANVTMTGRPGIGGEERQQRDQAIRKAYGSGMTQAAIAELYGLHENTVRKALKRTKEAA